MSIGRPLVLCLSGLDPTGGAGIQADIEAVSAAGCHGLPIVTVLTVQDSRNVASSISVAADLIARQIDTLTADCRIDAVKIGLLGDAEQTRLIANRISRLNVPVVCDPVLRAGGGTDLANVERVTALCDSLLPQVTVLTPNAAELRRLSVEAGDIPGAARSLLERGCGNVLVTGGDEPGEKVVNLWFASDGRCFRYEWQRLPETFHGAGCTLAAAIAANLARGMDLAVAISEGQGWTQESLRRAYAVGRGRRIPDRTFPESR